MRRKEVIKVCPDKRLLVGYALRALPREDMKDVKAHIKWCDACAAQVGEFRLASRREADLNFIVPSLR